MYQVFFTAKAEKELLRLSTTDKKRVLQKIQKLSSPFSHSLNIKKLINVTSFYRLRIGKVRIIFEIDHQEKEVWIRKIGYRGSIYQP